MTSISVAHSSFLATTTTALFLRPIEAIIGAALMLVGRCTPASLRGSPAGAVVLGVLWFATSATADFFWLGANGPFPVAGALAEVVFWTFTIPYAARLYGHRDRAFQAWFAMAGVSILAWGAQTALLYLGVSSPALVICVVCAVAIRGYGHVFQTSFRSPEPYLAASVLLVLVGMIVAIVKTVPI